MREEMGSHHQDLLFHPDARWLPRGRILGRVMEIKTEREVFLQEIKHKLADCFIVLLGLAKQVYLRDIFRHLNELNSDIQGRNESIVGISEKFASFKKKKLALRRERLTMEKTEACPKVNAVLEYSSEIATDDVKVFFQDHLKKLQEEMGRYYPDNVDLCQHSLVRNVLGVNVSEVGEDIPGFQEELIDLQENRVQKQRFESLSYSEFWAQLRNKPILTGETGKALLHFGTIYLCEQGFSTLVTIRTKARNLLGPQHDLRCGLSINVKPNLEELA